MSETEPFPGFFPLPNVVADTWLPQLKDTELRMLLVIIRQTAGFVDPKTGARKERDWLSQSRLKQATGRAEGPLARAIASLIAQGLIIAEDEAAQPLETAAQRRRHLGRIYYRPGPALLLPSSTAPTNYRLVSMIQTVFADAELTTPNIPPPHNPKSYTENRSAYAEIEEANAESGISNVHITKNNQDKRTTQMQFLHSERPPMPFLPPAQKRHTTPKSEPMKREALKSYELKSYEQLDVPLTEAQRIRIEAARDEIRKRLARIKQIACRPRS